jgi:hypothetical protein
MYLASRSEGAIDIEQADGFGERAVGKDGNGGSLGHHVLQFMLVSLVE